MNPAEQKSLFADDRPQWEIDQDADRLFIEVALDLPLDGFFTYEVPYPLREQVAVGKRVSVPFGRRAEASVGFCVRILPRSSFATPKLLCSVLDQAALVSPEMIELARWISQEYCCSLGQTLSCMIPGGVRSGAGTRETLFLRLDNSVAKSLDLDKFTAKQRRILEVLSGNPEGLTIDQITRHVRCSQGPVQTLRKRGILASAKRRILIDNATSPHAPTEQPRVLNRHQQEALDRISLSLRSGTSETILLHGVTGSGKTEVYLQAIQLVVESQRQAIVLVPEISLTPQTIRRFKARFPNVAVLHSHLSDGRRHVEWQRIAAGESKVVIGARSAIFAPTPKLGLIVLDEEHEGSFKQETTPRYHARDVARERAAMNSIPLILGSATPSLESWVAARRQEYRILELPERVNQLPLPDVKLIDMRAERRGKGAISMPLQQACQQALHDGGQIIMLLNRRGFSTQIMCYRCGFAARCPRCDISLVYHRSEQTMLCHFCDLEQPPYQECPECKDPGLSYRGLGTEKLEREVRMKFPHHPCRRMDTDSMRKPGSHEQALQEFREGKTRILLGTQMIAKGLDFPNVTLVGVISADVALHLPDFRAAERTFQLIAQVAGRTGRGERPGRVLVQTYNPGNAAIAAASKHDFHTFVDSEVPLREALSYPPFGRMCRIILRSSSEKQVQDGAARLGELLRREIQSGDRREQLRILGPAPAPITRLKNYFRYHLQIHGPLGLPFRELLDGVLKENPLGGKVELAIDVDPLSML